MHILAKFSLFMVLFFVSCAKKSEISNIYNDIVYSDLFYRFHLKDVPFEEIASYLEHNKEKIDRIYFSISIPTKKDHLTEMIPIGKEDLKLSQNQNLILLGELKKFLKEKVSKKNSQLMFDFFISFKFKDGSGAQIQMETVTYGEWNRISYGVFMNENKLKRVITNYRISDPIGLQKFIAEFAITYYGDDNSRGFQQLVKIWPDLKKRPEFVNETRSR